jgi:hypothetical protein
MKYDLDRLNSYDFEHLAQALTKKLIGPGATSFGSGTDGGREATYQGSAPFPSSASPWDGYWVIQAKFKQAAGQNKAKDFEWMKSELVKELKKYATRKTKVKFPENYILFTNITLTATAGTGTRDQANKLEQKLESEYKLKHLKIISHDDVTDLLSQHRDIATAYAPFILPGDILAQLLELLNKKDERNKRIKTLVSRFLEIEFNENAASNLDHAGKLTDKKINLEKVFIDLTTRQEEPETKATDFIDSIVTKGNAILKDKIGKATRFIIIGGPGYGKSTLTQFLTQIYRAHFLTNANTTASDEVRQFIKETADIIKPVPKWVRFPIKIILKEYAGWIKEITTPNNSASVSVVEYVKMLINKKTTGNLTSEEIETLIINLPTIFVFDGLDEVPASSNREQVLNEINIFNEVILRTIGADSIVICTTRPQGYSKEFDSNKYSHHFLLELNAIQCRTYLTRLVKQIIDTSSERTSKLKILTSALAHPIISRLMKSPLQASIMTILVKSGGEPPRNKYDLFTEYYEIIFRREKQRDILQVLSEHPQYVKDIHNRLGLYLQIVSEKNTNPSATITTARFNEMITEYLTRYSLKPDEITRITSEIVTAATHRLVFISELEEQKIGFAIRSLQEFFAANGYIHSIPDERLVKLLKIISHSSYWSNTLLFAIGYLSKTKDYLIDSVEAICGELNGSTTELSSKDLSSIPKMGSWLALEIVNEGIFRSFPSIENKFCNLLGPLFEIAPNKKHEEFSRLPEKIISTWCTEYLSCALNKSIANYAAWSIGFRLFHNPEIEALLEEKWPTDIKSQNTILTYLIKNQVVNDFVINRLIQCIPLMPKNDLWFLFSDPKYHPLLSKVCGVKHLPKKTKSVLVELLFFSSVVGDVQNASVLLNKLGTQFRPEEKAGNLFRFQTRDVLIVPRYSYTIRYPTLLNPGDLQPILKFALENEMQLLTASINFFIAPNYFTYKAFLLQLANETQEHKMQILSRVVYCNALTSLVFAKHFNDTDLDFTKAAQTILEIETRLQPENVLEYRRYKSSISLSFASPISETLVTFKQYYLDAAPTNLPQIEFISLYHWAFPLFSENDTANLTTLKKVYKQSLQTFILTKPQIKIDDLQAIFHNLELTELLEIYGTHFELLNTDLAWRPLNTAWFDHYINKGLFVDIGRKFCELVSLQINQGEKPAYKALLQQLTIGMNGVIFYLDFVSIPFLQALHNSSVAGDDENLAAILLFDKEFGAEHYQKFITLLSGYPFESSPSFVEILLAIIKHSPNNEYIDKTLQFLNTKIKHETIQARTEFESFIKAYVGNKPTKLEPTS